VRSSKPTDAARGLFKQQRTDTTDKASEWIASDSRDRLKTEALKTSRLRDQRLEREAAYKAAAKLKPKPSKT
jgi:hypothetical protein